MTPFLVLAQGVGVPATGYLRDTTGSYGRGARRGHGRAASSRPSIVLRVRFPERLAAAAASH